MTIKIYKPSKTAMQSGIGNTKKWLAEYISDVDNVKDSLMGWNSSFDTQSQIKVFFDNVNFFSRMKTKASNPAGQHCL